MASSRLDEYFEDINKDIEKIVHALNMLQIFCYDDIKKILPCCTIGLTASLGEAFSLSILEYLFSGLVVLAPNHCGNSEAILDGVNGFLYEPGNIAEVVSKIQDVIKSEDLAGYLRKNARKTAIDSFSLKLCNNKFISVIEKNFV